MWEFYHIVNQNFKKRESFLMPVSIGLKGANKFGFDTNVFNGEIILLHSSPAPFLFLTPTLASWLSF